jgi:4-aminobutyrate aminotransferase
MNARTGAGQQERFLRMDYKLIDLQTDIPGPKAKNYVARDQEAVSPSYTRSYPFVMARGEGSLAWDVDGNRYIDFNAGIAVVATGHAHPKVVEAIQQQAAKFVHMAGTDFYYAVQIKLAEKLNSLVPGDEPKQLFFTNSGAEAVEAALKLARYHTGRPQILAFLGAFHGRTMGAISLTASKVVQRRGFAPLVPGVTHIPYGYCYRCAYNLEYPSCGLFCLDYIESTLFKQLVPADEVAAIFVEPIQGEGGYVVPPPGYHARLKELAEKHGILFVADEIQMGMGRTGKWFSIEHWDVVPDITLIAKGIASGMPLGAMVAKRELMDWPFGAHGTTFGGNPVSCAAASATIQVIEEEGLVENAATLGKRVLDAAKEMQGRHPTIGDVRGKGLIAGLELVKDRETKEPAGALRDDVVERAFEKGLLLLGCGPSAVRFTPALTVDAETVDEALSIFEEALTEAEAAG